MKPSTEVAHSRTIRNCADMSRYEIELDGRLAGIAEYEVYGDIVVFPHTALTPTLRAPGLADDMVRFALDDVRAAGRKVVPACSFVRQFIAQHDEYEDLIDPAKNRVVTQSEG